MGRDRGHEDILQHIHQQQDSTGQHDTGCRTKTGPHGRGPSDTGTGQKHKEDSEPGIHEGRHGRRRSMSSPRQHSIALVGQGQQAENMAKAILEHGSNIWFSSDSYKAGTTLVDGSYSLLVQYYVKKHGGQLANGIDTPVEVIVRVHESDQFTADDKTIIFDPWRSYPKANNVVYYGKYN
jgi:hypothetical protein